MTGTRATGEWCCFRWFQASDLSLGSLVEAVPELVRDRVVVVTAHDSGPLRLTAGELAAGWRQAGSLAVRSKALPPSALPLGGWDEWYVFEDTPSVHVSEVFVNYGSFSLRTDTGNEWLQSATERFWGQLAEWWPESYLAEGDNLICVTRREALVPELVRYFSGTAAAG